MTTSIAFLMRSRRRSPARVGRLVRLVVAVVLTTWAQDAGAVWPVNPLGKVPVCTESGTQSAGRLLADGRGGVYVGWSDQRNGAWNTYVHHVAAGGYLDPRWSIGGLALAAQSDDQHLGGLHADADSGLVVVWLDERGTDHNYAQHLLPDGELDPAWPVTGLALTTGAYSQFPASSVSDGVGGAIAAWSEYTGAATGWDVVAQRVSPAGTRLWAEAGVTLCNAAGNQLSGVVVGDAAAGAVVAWVDERAGSSADDIYAQRVLAAGTVDPRWPANGLAVCTAALAQTRVSALSDYAGGAFVAWADTRSGTRGDLYMHHVLGDGTLDAGWPTDGLFLRDSVSDQLEPRLVADGTGGIFVFTAGYDVPPAIQHVLGSGTLDPAWPAEGVALATDIGSMEMVTDAAGGLLLLVEDHWWEDSDLYAHHLLADGTWDPGWPGTGVAVSEAAGRQAEPVAIADGAGGAFTAWIDERDYATTGWDAYAQRVLADGALGHPAPAITAVQDVPDDEGGSVLVVWSASEGEAAPNGYVSSYMLWRRITDAEALVATRVQADAVDLPRPGAVRMRTLGAEATWWEFLAQVPAMEVPAYAYTVATTGDLCPEQTPWNVFVVDAVDDALWAFYASAPDSGYSVDNLPPGTPSPFRGEYDSGTATLYWGGSTASDLLEYRLYRGHSSDFVPDDDNLVVATCETSHADTAGAPYYYKLAAVDVHGNVSPYAMLLPDGTVDAPGGPPLAFALDGARPNPARAGRVTVAFTLARRGPVRLELLDVSGRRLAAREVGSLGAGHHAIDLGDGRRFAPGVYLVCLRQGADSRVARVVVLK